MQYPKIYEEPAPPSTRQTDAVCETAERLVFDELCSIIEEIMHAEQVESHLQLGRGQPDVGRRLKALREERKLSMRELASLSGTSVSLISKIEAGKVSPTVLSLQKIVESMGVEMYEFFLNGADTDPSEQIVFKRSSMVLSEDEEHTWYFAFPKHPDIKAQLSYEEYQPHSRRLERMSHKGDIFGLVIAGELTLEVNGKGTFKASAGDAFYIKAGIAHRPRNDGDKVLKLMSIQLRS